MKYLIITVIVSALYSCAFQKITSSNEDHIKNYFEGNNLTDMSETSPFPIGGIEAMQSQINYPREAIMNHIEG